LGTQNFSSPRGAAQQPTRGVSKGARSSSSAAHGYIHTLSGRTRQSSLRLFAQKPYRRPRFFAFGFAFFAAFLAGFFAAFFLADFLATGRAAAAAMPTALGRGCLGW